MRPQPIIPAILGVSLITATLSAQSPKVNESGHTLTLFADTPDIVTPIGMAVDKNDQVFVIESHTHNPPSSYAGPKGDIVKVFTDQNEDGVADSTRVFAEGLNQAMNLAFSPDGTLYALCAKALVALPDRDHDGKCDRLETVLRLETESGNAHGNWLGLDFDSECKVYLGRGNIGSHHYRVKGKDGTLVEGYGDGGNLIRANPDGTKVEEWATGFWNPMDLKFDHKNRLMLVDNDPDGRGPNRLLEVVRGGDYGYKSVFGGWGRHPFQGWDGSLPGTLPFISGTGEAPSGLIDVSSKSADSYLVTIWNENTIERHSISGGKVSKSIFMSGDKDFRPVALAGDSKGNLYITDWMLVDYPNHGKGRIWKVTGVPLPETTQDKVKPKSPARRTIVEFLQSDDPFERHKGEMWLSEKNRINQAKSLASHSDPLVRLGAILAMRRSKDTDLNNEIRKALSDPDLQVRRIALMWAGETLDLDLRPDLDQVLISGPVDHVLFEAYLAAVEMLEPSFAQAFGQRENPRAYRIPRKLDPKLLDTLAWNEDLPSAVRALAIGRLGPEDIGDFLKNGDPTIRLAAIQKASAIASDQIKDSLIAIALDQSEGAAIRSEAILGLSRQILTDPVHLLSLLEDPHVPVSIEATRTLRWHTGNETVRNALLRRYESWMKDSSKRPQAEIAEAALFGNDPSKQFAKARPQNLVAWNQALSKGGNPERGSRVFRTQQLLCASCHSIDGQGSEFGPNLSGLAQSVDRASIIQSILDPSISFSPDFQAWEIVTKDGKTHQGVQIDHRSQGDIDLFTIDARKNVRFKAEEIVDFGTSPHSLMPAGLENLMTVSEFRDLIAYLSNPE
jgi:putative membrane-bound dehydrogenase-like protein